MVGPVAARKSVAIGPSFDNALIAVRVDKDDSLKTLYADEDILKKHSDFCAVALSHE